MNQRLIFDEDRDRDAVYLAINNVLAEAQDILFHHVSDGAWVSCPEDAGAAELIRQGAPLIERLEKTIQDARREVTRATRAAWLRGINAELRRGLNPALQDMRYLGRRDREGV